MFLQKSFIGKNKWYLYLLVLVLVFVLAQVGGIPFAVYAMMTNLDAVQAGDTAALSQVRDTAGLALMLFSFAVGLLALVVFARIFQGKRFVDYTTGRRRWDVRRFGFGFLVWSILVTLVTVQQVLSDADVVLNFEPSKFFPLLLVGLGSSRSRRALKRSCSGGISCRVRPCCSGTVGQPCWLLRCSSG